MERSEENATALSRAREAREATAALCGEAAQAHRHAAELRAESNAILDAVSEMMAHLLRRRGFSLGAPVAASFRTQPSGSTGIEVLVRLSDPSHANAARTALLESFPDDLSNVIVT
jgi:hypothetical protein